MRFRYTEWDGGARGLELYDHESDPQELRNLSNRDDHAAIIDEMKQLLRNRLKPLEDAPAPVED